MRRYVPGCAVRLDAGNSIVGDFPLSTPRTETWCI